jgi:type I restriction enzyme S subunit
MSSDDREHLTIGELIARDGGSIKTGPFGTALKASEYSLVGTPLISVREIGHGSFHIDSKTPRVSKETTSRLPEYLLEDGDIVFARKGGIERCALIKKPQIGWFLGSDGIRLRPPKTCDVRFLAASLQTQSVKDWLIQNSTGSTMASLNQATISRLPISLPIFAKQKEVAEILDSLDDRISLLRETNTTLEAIAQALFKSWFVDFDPVRAKQQGREPEGMDASTAALFPDSFEESELGLVPMGWRVGKVEQLLELAYGKALKATDRIAGIIPVYGSGGVTGYHNEALVNTPSIVIGRKGTVGSLYWEDRPFFPIDTVFYVKTKEPLTYCFYQLQLLGMKDMNTDGAVPGLNRNNVYRLPIILPSHEALLAFDEIVSPLRQKIFTNSEQAQTLANLRDTLLPRLISGQLRLPDSAPA